MGRAVMAKRQQRDLNAEWAHPSGLCFCAEETGLRLVGDPAENRIDFAPISFAPEFQEREPAELPLEQGVDPGPADAERKPDSGVVLEHERVGQNASDRSGFDIVALWGGPSRPESVPIRVELHRDFMSHHRLHTRASPSVPKRNGMPAIAPALG